MAGYSSGMFAALLLLMAALMPVPALAQSSSTAAAASTESTVLAVPLPAEVPQLRLRGSGQFRWFGLRIYEASLWSVVHRNASGSVRGSPREIITSY